MTRLIVDDFDYFAHLRVIKRGNRTLVQTALFGGMTQYLQHKNFTELIDHDVFTKPLLKDFVE